MRHLVCIAALAGALSLTSMASAEPTEKQRAAELFAGGEAALKRGDFTGAGAAFEQAALYAPHPSALLNAAEAWELAGDLTRAAELCDRALAMKGIEKAHANIANKQLARLEKKIATIDVVVPADTRVAVDDRDGIGPRRVRLKPGAHAIGVAGGSRETLTLAAGETRSWSPPAAPPPEPAKASAVVTEPTKPVPTSSRSVLPWIAFGVAGASGLAAAYFGFVQTAGAVDDFNANPTRATESAFDRNVVITDVLIGVAVAAAAAGGVLWLTTSPAKTEGRRAAFTF